MEMGVLKNLNKSGELGERKYKREIRKSLKAK
jgi:hypothetical protein